VRVRVFGFVLCERARTHTQTHIHTQNSHTHTQTHTHTHTHTRVRGFVLCWSSCVRAMLSTPCSTSRLTSFSRSDALSARAHCLQIYACVSRWCLVSCALSLVAARVLSLGQMVFLSGRKGSSRSRRPHGLILTY